MPTYAFEQAPGGFGAAQLFSTIVPIAVVLVLVAAGIFAAAWWWRRQQRWLLFLNHQEVPEVIALLRGSQFETWVEQLLRSVGIQATQVGQQGDHGIDVVATYRGKKVGIQCKKFHDKLYIGESIIRDLYGAQRHFGYAAVVLFTTTNFSYSARRWAEGKRDLALVNGYALGKIVKDRRLLIELFDRLVGA